MKNLLSSKSLSIFYDSQRKHFTYLNFVKLFLLKFLGLFSRTPLQVFGNKSLNTSSGIQSANISPISFTFNLIKIPFTLIFRNKSYEK